MPNQRSTEKSQFSFWIKKETKAMAEQLAEQQGKTFTEVITELLENYLENADLSDCNADQRTEMLADLEPTEEKPKPVKQKRKKA